MIAINKILKNLFFVFILFSNSGHSKENTFEMSLNYVIDKTNFIDISPNLGNKLSFNAGKYCFLSDKIDFNKNRQEYPLIYKNTHTHIISVNECFNLIKTSISATSIPDMKKLKSNIEKKSYNLVQLVRHILATPEKYINILESFFLVYVKSPLFKAHVASAKISHNQIFIESLDSLHQKTLKKAKHIITLGLYENKRDILNLCSSVNPKGKMIDFDTNPSYPSKSDYPFFCNVQNTIPKLGQLL